MSREDDDAVSIAGPAAARGAERGGVEPLGAVDDDAVSIAEARRRSARARSPLAPLLAVAVAAACLWGSSRMTWVRVSSADGLGVDRVNRLLGSTWFGALTPLALALLASIAAVLATKGGWRQLFGVVIALIGGVTAVPALALLTHSSVSNDRAKSLADLPARAHVTALHVGTFPAVLALVGAVLAFVAGVWLARRPATTGLSGKYRTPAARRAEATRRVSGATAADESLSQRVLWDALDAGEDPTEPADDRPRD